VQNATRFRSVFYLPIYHVCESTLLADNRLDAFCVQVHLPKQRATSCSSLLILGRQFIRTADKLPTNLHNLKPKNCPFGKKPLIISNQSATCFGASRATVKEVWYLQGELYKNNNSAYFNKALVYKQI
jgi:hypothetical protein